MKQDQVRGLRRAQLPVVAAAASAMALMRATPAMATTYWWIGANSDWSNGNNWSLNQNGAPAGTDPTANSNVNFIDSFGEQEIGYDYIGAPITLGTLTINVNDDGYNQFNIAANNLSAVQEIIGNTGDGQSVVYQSGGTNTATSTNFNNPALSLGSAGGYFAAGNYTLHAGALTTSNTLGGVAESVIGYFNQDGGSNSINAGELDLGTASGSTGTYSLSGTGSLSVTGDEYVGGSGAGFFYQTGGTHTVSSELDIAAFGGSAGTYSLSAGSVSTGLLVVGGTSF